MSLVFVGKSLSCIAATGTMGAVAVIPKIKSTLVSVEKDIFALLDDLGEKREVFQQLVDVIENDTIIKNEKEQKVKKAIEEIFKWQGENGGCRVNFVISAENKTYFKVTRRNEKIEDIPSSLLTPHSKMGGKSKLERLAEDLKEENSRSGSDKDKHKKYLEDFKTRCKEERKGQFLRLHWRGQIFESSQETIIHSEGLDGLINLWVIEKVNSKG